jgi:hypothetical protein
MHEGQGQGANASWARQTVVDSLLRRKCRTADTVRVCVCVCDSIILEEPMDKIPTAHCHHKSPPLLRVLNQLNPICSLQIPWHIFHVKILIMASFPKQYLRIREVPGSSLCQETVYPDWGFPQSLQKNVGIIPRFRLLPSKSFPVHHSRRPITLSFDAI